MRRAVTICVRSLAVLAIGLSCVSAGDAVQGPRGAPVATPSIGQGRALYAGFCSGCHGKHLEGQASWQVADGAARRRAPALDQTGHAWLLSQDALLQSVKMGQGAMPAYRNTLDDEAIRSVLAFVQSRWPVGIRVEQALLTPGTTMPAADADWKFAGRCKPGH